MTTPRTRQDRRTARAAIWRAGAAAVPLEAETVQHGVRERGFGGARIVSGIIALSMIMVLVIFFTADLFYVRGAAIGGTEYLTVSDVYTIAGVDSWHLFWIDPADVRVRLMDYPTIADATVQTGWPPNMVQIVIEEREPALVWEQAGVAVWIDLQGRVMSKRADIDGLPRVVADSLEADPLGPNMRLPVDVVSGALQLHLLKPEIPFLRYHPNKGLGYNDPGGWEAWFGSGANMSEKLLIYNAIVARAQPELGAQLNEVNVGSPDAPVYCCKVR